MTNDTGTSGNTSLLGFATTLKAVLRSTESDEVKLPPVYHPNLRTPESNHLQIKSKGSKFFSGAGHLLSVLVSGHFVKA